MPLVPYSPPYIAWAGTYFNLEQALSTPSLAINTSSLTVSSINGLPPGGGGSAISSFSFASISSLNVSSINGLLPGASSSNVFSATQTNPLTINSSSFETLTLSPITNPQNWWATSNSSFKPTISGFYFLSAQMTIGAPIADSSELKIQLKNNYTSVILATTVLGGASVTYNDQTITTSAICFFNGVDDNVSVIGFNDTQASVAVATGDGLTTFDAFLIGGSPGAAGPTGPAGPAGGSASTISSFNTASISSATISSISGWSPNALSTVVGGSDDAATLAGSLWAYSKQAEVNAQIGITWITNATTPDAVGEIGTSVDTPSLATSLWAYARYAEGASDTNLGSIQTLSTIVANLSTFNTASISSLSVSSINFNAPGTPFYNLLGTTAGAVLSNHPVGSNFPFTALTFNLATTLTFNTPPTWQSGNSVVYDGWALYNFNATAINTFWGVAYATSTQPTPTDILGSTTASNAALNYPNASQVYMPVNIIIPSTDITAGGTITLTFYVYVAIASQYFATAPVVNGRIGISLD